MNNINACDDSSVCTASDTCNGGKCVGKAISCDDANVCTTDACDAVKGCGHANVVDGAVCPGGLCAAGNCKLTYLIAHYAFEEASGTKFLDSSGNGNDGSHNAAYVAGKKGQALSFGGTALAKVTTGGPTFTWGANNADYTVEYWIYVIGVNANWVSPFHKSDPTGLDFGPVYKRSPAHFFYPGLSNIVSVMSTVADANHYYGAGTGALPLKTWIHFAVVHSGGSQLLYINGILIANDPLGSPTTGGPGVLYLGNDGFYAGLNGYMDEVKIYSKALTIVEIQADML